MKTVNEIAKITGISRRAIRYYDQIGLLRPTKISESGYRLYDDKALEVLQQILFFKELDVSLKEIKQILKSSNLDRISLLKNHKEMLTLKRDRLNGLIELINKTIKEPKNMSFIEFDFDKIEKILEENLKFLKDLKGTEYANPDYDVKKCMKQIKEKPEVIEAMYGSLENYYEILKQAPDRIKNVDSLMNRVEELSTQIAKLKDKDVSCPEVQNLIAELDTAYLDLCGTGLRGFNNGGKIEKESLKNIQNKEEYNKELQLIIEKHDKLYGSGAFDFRNKAIKYYLEQHK